MEDTKISNMSSTDIMEVIDDDELKFEVEQCVKELQVNFIGMESLTLDMDFVLPCTQHKLNFKVHKSKTCFFVNRQVTTLYSKYLFL